MHPWPIFTLNLFGKTFGVYFYGVLIAIGIVAALLVLFFYTKRKGVPEKVQDFMFFVGIFAIALGFLCAKLFQAFYDWIDSGFSYFDFYGAGITAMGGFVGGALFFIIFYFIGGKLVFKGKEKNLHLKHFNDVFLTAPCCITIAHAFGRLGCLTAGCCHGKYIGQTDAFGAVKRWVFDSDLIEEWLEGSYSPVFKGYYVPVQLYEAIFLFVLFGVLTFLFFKRSNITMPIYLIAYAIWRFIIEIFRTDDRGAVVLGLYPSQWQSVAFLVVGAGVIIFYLLKKIPFWLPKDTEKNKNKQK